MEYGKSAEPKGKKSLIKITGDRAERIKKIALDYLHTYRNNMQTLQDLREQIHREYMQEPYGTEKKGRSQVVASDVSDTVESILPSLMRIFWGSQDVVNVNPVGGQGDTEKAKLMENKLNFDIQYQNKGFLIFHDWFKDALMQKPGIVKYLWRRGTDRKFISFENLNYYEFQFQKQRQDLVIKEVFMEPIEGMAPGLSMDPRAFKYDVTGWLVDKYSKPVVYNVAPPDFVFDVYAKSIQESPLTGERIRCHKNTLKKYGLTKDDIDQELQNFSGTNSEINADTERIQLYKDLGTDFIQSTSDKETDFVYKYECYLDEYDENGEPTPVKVLIFGDRVLDVEINTYDSKPYCDLSSVRMPHRAVGRTAAELASDIQKLKTSVLRYLMDNIYYQNGPTKIINPFVVNQDDVYNNNVPEGVIRLTKNVPVESAIKHTPVKPIAPQAFKIFELLDEVRENRVGVTRYNQGLDAKSLNRTASGIAQVMNAAMQRIEMIARLFAETGVRDLFQALVDMNLKFYDSTQMIRIDEEWQEITPGQISGKYDVTIDVGSGTGSKELKVTQLTNMLNTYGMLMKVLGAVVMGHPDPVEKMKFLKMVSADNIYYLVRAIWENMGYKDIDKYWTDITKLGGINGQGAAAGAGAQIPGVPGISDLLGLQSGDGGQGIAGLLASIGGGAMGGMEGQPVGAGEGANFLQG